MTKVPELHLHVYTGAYIGLLQQLRTILEPSDTWQPGPPTPAPQPQHLKPKDIWLDPRTAMLRWQPSCFQDLTGTWRSYKRLQPGKYADRVCSNFARLTHSHTHVLLPLSVHPYG